MVMRTPTTVPAVRMAASDRLGSRLRLSAWLIVGLIAVGVAAASCSGDSQSDSPPVATTTGVDRDSRLAALIDASGLGDPSDVIVPAPTGTDAQAWLNDGGAKAVQLVRVTDALWIKGLEACATTAKSLDEIGTPEDVLAAAAGTPDVPTQEILVNLQRSTGDTLSTCSDAGAFDEALPEFVWNWALARDRLKDLGVVE